LQIILKLIGILMLLTAFNAGIVQADSSGVFGIRGGIGYDYISQEYFLDSLRLAGEDSLVTATLLKRQYLDDKKAFLYLSLDNRSHYGSPVSYFLEGGWEQTDEILRGILKGSYRQKSGKSEINGEIGLDLKQRYRGETSAGEEVTVLEGRFKYARDLSDRTRVGLKAYGEGVWFDSVSTFVYNYHRIGMTAGLDFLTENFNAISLGLTGEIRNVPDSSDLDYKLLRGGFGYLGTVWGGYSSTNLSLEYRDYSLADGFDDYFLAAFYTTTDWPIAEKYYLSTNANLELFNYTINDFVNSDYFLGRFDLLLKRNFGSATLTMGPKTEVYLVETEYTADDDYYELAGMIGFDYISLEGVLLLVENQIGRRNYSTAQIFTSDFYFNRLTLIGSARIWRGLSLDFFLSSEWEWHEIDSDDNRIYLITSSLSYSF